MTLNASQLINNMERSFNVYLEDALVGETINFNEDPFDTAGLESWFSVRYTGYSSESTGMGDMIDEDTNAKGRFHALKCEFGAWTRDDPQRTELGGMVDLIVATCEVETVDLYDFADPENPQLIGEMRIKPGRGDFSPPWRGGGIVGKSSGDAHTESNMTGFVLEVELIAVAQISQ